MIIRVVPVGMLMTNCYLVMDEATKEGMIIDPGARAERILDTVKELEMNVKYICFTHGHYDHVMAAHEIKEITNCQILINDADAWLLKKEEMSKFGKYTTAKYVEVAPDGFLKDGDIIKLGQLEFEVLSTPGHSDGCICLICQDVIFSGDTLFKGTCGRCDLVTGSLEKMYQIGRASCRERV